MGVACHLRKKILQARQKCTLRVCPHTKLLLFAPREESLRAARTGFEHMPADLSKAELFRYFTYSAEDRHAIFECRGRHNKVGFALLLGCVRLTGRFPLHFHALPDNLLAHVCQQLKVGALLRLDYAQRAATLYAHKERLREYLGLRYVAVEEQADLILACVREGVRAGRAPDELMERTEERTFACFTKDHAFSAASANRYQTFAGSPVT